MPRFVLRVIVLLQLTGQPLSHGSHAIGTTLTRLLSRSENVLQLLTPSRSLVAGCEAELRLLQRLPQPGRCLRAVWRALASFAL